jgi:hypothetical protein
MFTGASATAKAAMAIVYNHKTCSDPSSLKFLHGRAYILSHCDVKTKGNHYLEVRVTVDYHGADLQSLDVSAIRLFRKQRGGFSQDTMGTRRRFGENMPAR